MGSPNPESPDQQLAEQVLGYLNFSSGVPDDRFMRNLDSLFAEQDVQHGTTVCQVIEFLQQTLQLLADSDASFNNANQALDVLETTGPCLEAYRDYHADLLFHQPDEQLFNSFFVGLVMQSILRHRADAVDQESFLDGCLAELNDFIGHRQVATLESQKIEAYSHEWVCPIPIYLAGAGAAHGRYQQVVQIAIEFLQQTDPEILRAAFFDPQRLKVLAFDPRAYDFDHPINKRPNHQFGQWDEHSVDQSGLFYRFIVQQVTLDALLDRATNETLCPEISQSERMVEAGAVLAGTILMASGISGDAPDTFDSNTTLAKLLPTIAGYRDQFYRDLLDRLPQVHRDRLRAEAEVSRQPFGQARQHLNRHLARLRASQLVNCRLASIFAKMGFSEAAEKQSQVVPVASARFLCQIDCLLSSANQRIHEGELRNALTQVPRIISLLRRGVECGAIVDPWNILGFDANFSLFPANENTVPDHRAYELVELVERILGLYSKLWSEAAAIDDLAMCQEIRQEFSDIVDWWRKYAAHQVMAVDAVDPLDIFQAAEHVANALNLWHKGGAEAGNIQFWGQYADLFDSPKAYALVIDALMQRSDYKTATALMVHWLSQAGHIRLQQGDSSFHNLLWRWISEQRDLLDNAEVQQREVIWNRIQKFYDFIEVNADHYWQVPRFEIGRNNGPDRIPVEPEMETEVFADDEDSEVTIYQAAYEDVTYVDSTDDGMDGPIFEPGSSQDEELEAETDRVNDRLEFLATLAGFWRIAATVPLPIQSRSEVDQQRESQLRKRRAIVSQWIEQASRNRSGLMELLKTVYRYRLPKTGVDHDSMAAYDKHRLYKETLLERIMNSCVETENALRMLSAVGASIDYLIDDKPLDQVDSEVNGSPLITLFAAVLLSDRQAVREHFPDLIDYLGDRELLYVPLSKGGKPESILSARGLQASLHDLLGSLPRLGLITETHELAGTALAMERNQKVARGAVTEFDDLFQVAYTSSVNCLVRATKEFEQQLIAQGLAETDASQEAESALFDCVEMLTESMLIMWLNHSKTLRLTVLEKVNDKESWNRLVEFIQRYGAGLFTQEFLNLSSIRSILHQGADVWFQNVRDASVPLDLRIIDELGTALPMEQAVSFLTLVLEAVYENYNEYRDYNATTTQSDRGEEVYIFLDFLRLRGRYDRVCWNLKPVVWGHEILVRCGETSVARMWRRSLTDRVGPEAEKFLNRLEEMRRNYSIQMDTVGRRLEERFSQPLQIDRLRSLVRPAMQTPGSRKSQRAFDLLQHEAHAFCRATVGVGVDLPSWLAALENEVQKHRLPLRLRAQSEEGKLVDPVATPIAELREQLEGLPRRHRSSEGD
ncbi:MAG: hypothetical protein MK108_13830 [Mariniblastus sp.]|nr:hypothetical protein [Mariniblastus sp.]